MENETELAYAEVDAILELLEDEFVNRIPEKVREFFKDEKDKEYKPVINIDISLNEQNLRRKTIVLLAILNLNYWCDSEEEKQDLLNTFLENDEFKRKELKELQERYNPENLFKKKEKNEIIQEVSIIEYKKQNFIKRILLKIKKLFKR